MSRIFHLYPVVSIGSVEGQQDRYSPLARQIIQKLFLFCFFSISRTSPTPSLFSLSIKSAYNRWVSHYDTSNSTKIDGQLEVEVVVERVALF